MLSVTTFISLANLVSTIWKTMGEGQQKKLDREQQLRIHEERMRHELLMQEGKGVFTVTGLPDEDDPFLERLRLEGELLSRYNYNVVYETVDDGYGLAIPVDLTHIVALWLSRQYPLEPPNVFLCSDTEIERIIFDEEAWNTDCSLAAVITAFAERNES